MSSGSPIPMPTAPQLQSFVMFRPSYLSPDVLKQFRSGLPLLEMIELFRTTSNEEFESTGPYRPIPDPGALNAMVLLLMVTYAFWLYSIAGPPTALPLMVLFVALKPYRTRI